MTLLSGSIGQPAYPRTGKTAGGYSAASGRSSTEVRQNPRGETGSFNREVTRGGWAMESVRQAGLDSREEFCPAHIITELIKNHLAHLRGECRTQRVVGQETARPRGERFAVRKGDLVELGENDTRGGSFGKELQPAEKFVRAENDAGRRFVNILADQLPPLSDLRIGGIFELVEVLDALTAYVQREVVAGLEGGDIAAVIVGAAP